MLIAKRRRLSPGFQILYVICVVASSLCASVAIYVHVIPKLFGAMVVRDVDPLVADACIPMAIVLCTAAFFFRLRATAFVMEFQSIKEELRMFRRNLDKEVFSRETRWIVAEMGDVISTDKKESPKGLARFAADVLAYGKLEIAPELFAYSPERFDDKDAKESWHHEMLVQRRLVHDVIEIWRVCLCDCPLATRSERQVRALGEALGIPQMIEAYEAGVPLEDIVAI